MDIFDQIAAGARPAPAPSAHPHQAPAATDEDLRLGYALAKQVPDMERGFTIGTSYGDIVITPGWVADFIADQVRMALKVELLKLTEKVTA